MPEASGSFCAEGGAPISTGDLVSRSRPHQALPLLCGHLFGVGDDWLRWVYAECKYSRINDRRVELTNAFQGLQILPSWQDYFGHPDGSLLGLYGSIFSLGSLCGLPFAPFIADRFGRKPSIWTGCAVLFVGVAVQSASQDFRMFIVSRFFIGFGCTLAQLSSPLLLTEIAHPQHRGKVTAVYNCLWNFGAIIATWLTFGTGHIQNTWAWSECLSFSRTTID